MAKINKTKTTKTKTDKATTKTATGKTLVVVESPSKAKTINKYLGNKYIVEASIGHIKDLKKFDMGIEIDNDFNPIYVTVRGKTDTIKQLKKDAEAADNVLLATDPDREGEAIAWHIADVLKDVNSDIKRVEFNEITKNAIKKAIQSPREIDNNLFQSQQARRVLDRIIGFKVSPFLSNAMLPITTATLSAGRVQSVAMRLICEREELINDFEPIEYWVINADFNTKNDDKLSSKLVSFYGKTIRNPEGSKKDFDSSAYHYIKSEQEANNLLEKIKEEKYFISSITKKQIKRKPSSPFTTSLLQQEASRKLGYSNKRTMQLAQDLYEGIAIGKEGVVGLITYMRTDSVRVSTEASNQAREFILNKYGIEYLPDTIPVYKSKNNVVQDAHEAIRPTFISYTPESISSYLSKEQLDLYRLIYNRFLSSQMIEARLEQTSIDITGGNYLFRSTGSVIVFNGYLIVYDEDFIEDKEILPTGLSEKDAVTLLKASENGVSTKAPARYNEASLVKELDELGIGRPSTYAQIVSTLLDREYVELYNKAFVPTPIGQNVNKVLVGDFPDLFNVDFTANMENDLDKIAAGDMTYLSLMKSFYKPFEEQLTEAEKKESGNRLKCELCGGNMMIKVSRIGRFLGCSNYPTCNNTKSLPANGGKLNEEKKPPVLVEGVLCEKCGSPMCVRKGKYSKFYGCSRYPACDGIKPIFSSIKCPKCGKGFLSERYSPKTRKKFWNCSEYPSCNFITNNEPLQEQCPKCGNPYLEQRYKKVINGFEKYKSCPVCKEKFDMWNDK
jgi:DNA topoisomerase-1